MKYFFSLIVFAIAFQVNAQPQKADAYDQFVLAKMKTDSFPGAVLYITKNGKPVKLGTYGLANIEQQSKARISTVFELASVSKPITTTAMMILIEQGKVGLDSPITAYLKNVPSTHQAITIRQLMSHTSGLPADHFNYYKLLGPTPLRYSVNDQLADLYKLPMKSKPGRGYLYSNAAFFMQAAIIEKVTGMVFAQFVKQAIFQKLGMNKTSYINGDSIVYNRAQGYTKRKSILVRSSLEVITQALDANGFGGGMSTVVDYEKFLQATAKHKLVSEQTFNLMTTPTVLPNNVSTTAKDGATIAIGWFVKDINGHKAFLHGGYSGTFALHFIKEDISVIFFTNLSSGYGAITGDKGFDFMKTGFEIAEMAVEQLK